MRDRPILMTAEMVRATLADRKRMTRRVVKLPPWMKKHGGDLYHRRTFADCGFPDLTPDGEYRYGYLHVGGFEDDATQRLYCPYGDPHEGDRLWVKETWGLFDTEPKDGPEGAQIFYRATEGDAYALRYQLWRPSIFMPRWASRILLDLLKVRAERVQDITDEDAVAEGCPEHWLDKYPTPRAWFELLWDQINAEPKPIKKDGKIDHYVSYPWEDIRETLEHRGKPWHICGNPWVWVVEFS